MLHGSEKVYLAGVSLLRKSFCSAQQSRPSDVLKRMIDSLEIAARAAEIADGGPIYYEFIHGATIKEPWNAWSSLFFFVPILYWIWRLRGEYRDNLIIVAILPFLFLNGLGSTLFHAYRASPFYLLLDWLPASLMVITISTYLWTKLLRKWYFAFPTVLGFYGGAIGLIILLMELGAPRNAAPNVGYFMIGASFILPLFFILLRIRFYKYQYVLLTLLFLLGALTFRTIDPNNPFPELLPQGTHFLWHISSALAVFSLGYYIYFIKHIDLRNPDSFPDELKARLNPPQ